MLRKYTVIIIFFVVILSGCTDKDINDLRESALNKSRDLEQNVIPDLQNISLDEIKNMQGHQIKVNIAVEISKQIEENNLQEIDLKEVQTHEDYKEMVDSINLAIKIINDKIDSDFKYFQKGIESYDIFMMEVNRYSPLIDNYNEFIQSSYNLVPSDDCSVDDLYIKGIKFAGEATLISGGAFYKTAYLTTGTLAKNFGLIKMSYICGPCVSTAMSSSHWIIRNSLTEKTTEVIEKVISTNCTNYSNKTHNTT